MKKILPPIAFLIAVLMMLVLHACWPIATVIVPPYHLFGIVLIAVGVGLSISGSRQFARVGANIKTFDAPTKLVTDGLFRYSRNPMYLGFVLALIGVSLTLNSVSTLPIPLLFFLLSDRWYIRFEEQRMIEHFGADYVAYRQRTRRWL